MKKIMILCLCAVLLFALAACRGLAVRSFRAENFIPGFANVVEQSPGHLALDTENKAASFEEAVAFYEQALAAIGAQQTRLVAFDARWDYKGTYGDGKEITVSIADQGSYIYIFVAFLGEIPS